MQDDTTCTEMIIEAQAEADLGFTLRDIFTWISDYHFFCYLLINYEFDYRNFDW